jgi:hypothetical protein
MFRSPFWTTKIPIWVSRPTADHEIATWKVSGWIFLIVGCFATINLVLWPIIGVAYATEVLIGLF